LCPIAQTLCDVISFVSPGQICPLLNESAQICPLLFDHATLHNLTSNF